MHRKRLMDNTQQDREYTYSTSPKWGYKNPLRGLKSNKTKSLLGIVVLILGLIAGLLIIGRTVELRRKASSMNVDISIQPENVTVAPGSTTNIELFANTNGKSVSGIELHINSSDANLVQLVALDTTNPNLSIKVGETVNPNSILVSLVPQCTPAGCSTFTGTGSIASVTLQAGSGSGSAQINLSGSKASVLGENANFIGDLLPATVSVGNTNTPTVNPTSTPQAATPTPSSNAPVYRGTTSGTASNTNSVSTASQVQAEANNVYLTAVVLKNTGNPRPRLSSISGMNLTWQKIDDQCTAGNSPGLEIWRGVGSATSGVVTATFTKAAANSIIAVTRYQVTDPTIAIGSSVSFNTWGIDGRCGRGTDTASYNNNINVGQNNVLVYAAALINTTSHTPGTGFTEREEIHQGDSLELGTGLAIMDKPVASGTTPIDGGLSLPTDWSVIGIEIR